jgi:hypothetical protein
VPALTGAAEDVTETRDSAMRGPPAALPGRCTDAYPQAANLSDEVTRIHPATAEAHEVRRTVLQATITAPLTNGRCADDSADFEEPRYGEHSPRELDAERLVEAGHVAGREQVIAPPFSSIVRGRRTGR